MTISGQVRGAVGDAGVAYEELRSHVLTGAAGNGAGLILLLREGLAAWLEGRGASSRRRESEVRPRLRTHQAAPVVSDPIHAGIVRVLASMILAS